MLIQAIARFKFPSEYETKSVIGHHVEWNHCDYATLYTYLHRSGIKCFLFVESIEIKFHQFLATTHRWIRNKMPINQLKCWQCCIWKSFFPYVTCKIKIRNILIIRIVLFQFFLLKWNLEGHDRNLDVLQYNRMIPVFVGVRSTRIQR